MCALYLIFFSRIWTACSEYQIFHFFSGTSSGLYSDLQSAVCLPYGGVRQFTTLWEEIIRTSVGIYFYPFQSLQFGEVRKQALWVIFALALTQLVCVSVTCCTWDVLMKEWVFPNTEGLNSTTLAWSLSMYCSVVCVRVSGFMNYPVLTKRTLTKWTCGLEIFQWRDHRLVIVLIMWMSVSSKEITELMLLLHIRVLVRYKKKLANHLLPPV